jgi:hypothetical protein
VPERARFSPTSTKSKVEHPPLEETKGHKFEEVKFANNFDSAAENLKTFSANISKKSKVLSEALNNITFGPSNKKEVGGTTPEVPKTAEPTSLNSFRLQPKDTIVEPRPNDKEENKKEKGSP